MAQWKRMEWPASFYSEMEPYDENRYLVFCAEYFRFFEFHAQPAADFPIKRATASSRACRDHHEPSSSTSSSSLSSEPQTAVRVKQEHLTQIPAWETEKSVVSEALSSFTQSIELWRHGNEWEWVYFYRHRPYLRANIFRRRLQFVDGKPVMFLQDETQNLFDQLCLHLQGLIRAKYRVSK